MPRRLYSVARPKLQKRFSMFLIGEALVGDGAELAHIDLMIGAGRNRFCKRSDPAFRRTYSAAWCYPPEPSAKTGSSDSSEGYAEAHRTGNPDLRPGTGRSLQSSC